MLDKPTTYTPGTICIWDDGRQRKRVQIILRHERAAKSGAPRTVLYTVRNADEPESEPFEIPEFQLRREDSR